MKNKVSFLSILMIILIQTWAYAIPYAPPSIGERISEWDKIILIIGLLAGILLIAFFIVSLVFGIAYLIRRKKLEGEKLKKAKGDMKFLLIGLSISALLLGITIILSRIFIKPKLL